MRVLAALLGAGILSGCHIHSMEFKNDTGRPIILVLKSGNQLSSISLPADGSVHSLLGLKGLDEIRYEYEGEVCRLETPFPELVQRSWNEAKQLRLLPCGELQR